MLRGKRECGPASRPLCPFLSPKGWHPGCPFKLSPGMEEFEILRERPRPGLMSPSFSGRLRLSASSTTPVLTPG